MPDHKFTTSTVTLPILLLPCPPRLYIFRTHLTTQTTQHINATTTNTTEPIISTSKNVFLSKFSIVLLCCGFGYYEDYGGFEESNRRRLAI